MPKTTTITTRNETGAEVIIDCLAGDDRDVNVAAAEGPTVGDQGARYRVSNTGQTVTRIDAGRYRIDETSETLIEV